jgi:hypothetical protein
MDRAFLEVHIIPSQPDQFSYPQARSIALVLGRGEPGALGVWNEPPSSFAISGRSIDHASVGCDCKFNPLALGQIQNGADTYLEAQVSRWRASSGFSSP